MLTLTVAVLALSTPAPASAHFGTIPPGGALPSDCSSQVRPTPEVVSANNAYNQTRGRSKTLPWTSWAGFSRFRSAYQRVDGNFVGTTDEILQWASCKWGIDEDVTRARAVTESSWRQNFFGDAGHSVGILQVKRMVAGDPHAYTYPACAQSTAYNADYATMFIRACYDDLFEEANWFSSTDVPSNPGDVPNDRRLWECVGLWYSGSWRSGNSDYISSARNNYFNRSWEGYG